MFVGKKRENEVRIDAFRYDAIHLESFDDLNGEDAHGLLQAGKWVWYVVTGLHDASKVADFCHRFAFHPLLTEDILNTTQRPKLDHFEGHIAFVTHLLISESSEVGLYTEQVALVLGDGFLVSFQESATGVFDPIHHRLALPNSKLRKRGGDYLAFALLDAVVDQYMTVIEALGDAIETMENKVFTERGKNVIQAIAHLRREVTEARRSVRPMIEVVNKFERLESHLLKPETLPFVRDLAGHTVQASESIEVYNELVTDAFVTYNTLVNNRLNDIIRVLTVISVIFMPLSFLAGVYGTNFQYMPELGYKYAYPIFWIVLILTAALMVVFFKRKRWL